MHTHTQTHTPPLLTATGGPNRVWCVRHATAHGRQQRILLFAGEHRMIVTMMVVLGVMCDAGGADDAGDDSTEVIRTRDSEG